MDLLQAYKDWFAWIYEEMPGLSPKVALHHLAIKTSMKPVKQTKRKFSPGVASLVAAEITKLREARFIRELQYPEWSANIVHVKKNFVSVWIFGTSTRHARKMLFQ